LDGPLPKWCPAVVLSRQDGRHSAVALLLKAALIQVSDYRLLGASGFSSLFSHPKNVNTWWKVQ
jgi:VIT1/CCC1 family predicted Fe2+/Mn2+ transporter